MTKGVPRAISVGLSSRALTANRRSEAAGEELAAVRAPINQLH